MMITLKGPDDGQPGLPKMIASGRYALASSPIMANWLGQ